MSDYRPNSAGLVLAAAMYVASAGRLQAKQFGPKLLNSLYARQGRISEPGEARLLAIAAQWPNVDIRLPIYINPRVPPAPAMPFVPHELALPTARKVDRHPVTAPPFIDWRAADGFKFLSRRLPELEAMVVGVAGPTLAKDLEPLLVAVDLLGPSPSGDCLELEPGLLRNRVLSGTAVSSDLPAIIASVNSEGVLIPLLDRLASAAPQVRDFTRLAELACAYSVVLRAY